MAGYDYVNLDELVRQNYHPESEEGVNKQINMELSAMYAYLSMVSLIIIHELITVIIPLFSPTISIELTWHYPTSLSTSKRTPRKNLSMLRNS